MGAYKLHAKGELAAIGVGYALLIGEAFQMLGGELNGLLKKEKLFKQDLQAAVRKCEIAGFSEDALKDARFTLGQNACFAGVVRCRGQHQWKSGTEYGCTGCGTQACGYGLRNCNGKTEANHSLVLLLG